MAKRMTARQRAKEEAAGRRPSAPKPAAAEAPKALPTTTADIEGERKAAEKARAVTEAQKQITRPVAQATVARRARRAREVTVATTPSALNRPGITSGISGYTGVAMAGISAGKRIVAGRKRTVKGVAESRSSVASAQSTLKALGEKPSLEDTEEMSGQMAEILARGTLRGKSASGVSKERAIQGVERVYKGQDYVPKPEDPEDFTQVTDLDVRGPSFKSEKEVAQFKDVERARQGISALMTGDITGRSPGMGGYSGRQPTVKKGVVSPRPTQLPSGEPLYPAAPFPNAATAARTSVDLGMVGERGSAEWRRARGYHFGTGRMAQATSGDRPFATPLRQQIVEQGLARLRGELFPKPTTQVSAQVVGTNYSQAQPAQPIEQPTNARQRRRMRRNTSGI